MLRALLKSVPDTATPARFVPALQPLEAREVPAVVAFATLADFSLADPAVSDPATAEPIGKVVMQDIHFTTKVSKSSP
jgi:hypothetical protein